METIRKQGSHHTACRFIFVSMGKRGNQSSMLPGYNNVVQLIMFCFNNHAYFAHILLCHNLNTHQKLGEVQIILQYAQHL